MSRTCSARPASICAQASDSPLSQPVQAAPMSIAPARSAPSWCATSGAAFGVSSSAASVATSTRSRSDASSPASASAACPAFAASESSRSPSAARRRSCTPVRWTIHCSVTPAPAAITSLPTTRSGTAIAIEASAASRTGRSAKAVRREKRSSWALGTGGLLGERRLGVHRLAERLADEVREHTPRSRLHELAGAAAFERMHDVEPADRVRERLDEPLPQVVERLGRDAGVDGQARLAHLDLGDEAAERLHGRLHQARVERARYRQALGANAALTQLRLGVVERADG